jgi:hypothetical protein
MISSNFDIKIIQKMNDQAFQELSTQLSEVAKHIPTRWGRIQNNRIDSKINMFVYERYDELDRAISNLEESIQIYYRRRWFLWKCAQCDEYIFYQHEGVCKNPNFKDSDWDIELFGNPEWRFDLKSTLIPKEFRSTEEEPKLTPKSSDLINFYYNQQSQGVRFGNQNRLFLVHNPIQESSENIFRVRFEDKKKAIDTYLETIKAKPSYRFFQFKSALSDVLFINESTSGDIIARIGSHILNC